MKWWWSSILLLSIFACSDAPVGEVARYTPLSPKDMLFFPKPPRQTYMTNVSQKFSIQKECTANASWTLLPFNSSLLELEKDKMRKLDGGKIRRYYFFLKPLQAGEVNLRFKFSSPDSTAVIEEVVQIAG